ncbi:hypothetical protein AWB85_07685 [Mycobacteroides immunogenum]|uniref:Uncharacterized protein n=1 Tax=Mycobacteroides immunogenum TaxID=83262 RepID=A0A179VAB0_9MYCO|nr:hypothetical protein [Mycobacteroides immunogenum]OAT68849.1 hypothetical protein AWB85_07685 [Mycobacteroides immunogenum]
MRVAPEVTVSTCQRLTTGVAGLALVIAAVVCAPVASAYDSWCDLIETHSPGIAIASEKMRGDYSPRDVDRLVDYYGKVIPQLNTVGYATFWYPNVWGSPDIRPQTRDLMAAMFDLQSTVLDGAPAASQVQTVDDTIAVLHGECAGKRGLPPRDI